MIIGPGYGPVWPIRKPLKALGFTVVVTETEINQRSIGNSIILNHQRFIPNNNYSFDSSFAKIFERYHYIIHDIPSSSQKNINFIIQGQYYTLYYTGTVKTFGMIFEMIFEIICESIVLIFWQSRVSVEKWICFVDLKVKSGPRLITSPNVFWSWLVFSLFYYRNYSDL